MRHDYVTGFFALIGTFMIVYILLPLVVIVGKQLFDWEMLMRTLHDELVLIALRNSLLTSTATMLISLFFWSAFRLYPCKKRF